MEEKVIKFYSELFQQEVNLIIDENLNNIEMDSVTSAKLAKTNEEIKNIQLPEING